MRVIYLSGNTGAGKSTLLALLQIHLATAGLKVQMIDESRFEHPNLLRMFSAPKRWSLPIELHFLTERYMALMECYELEDADIVLIERSMEEDLLFVRRYNELGILPAELVAAYTSILAKLDADCEWRSLHLYLDVPPDVSIRRLELAIAQRTRPPVYSGDALREYVTHMDRLYREWRQELRKPVVDVTVGHDGTGPEDVLVRASTLIGPWLRSTAAVTARGRRS